MSNSFRVQNGKNLICKRISGKIHSARQSFWSVVFSSCCHLHRKETNLIKYTSFASICDVHSHSIVYWIEMACSMKISFLHSPADLMTTKKSIDSTRFGKTEIPMRKYVHSQQKRKHDWEQHLSYSSVWCLKREWQRTLITSLNSSIFSYIDENGHIFIHAIVTGNRLSRILFCCMKKTTGISPFVIHWYRKWLTKFSG